MAFDLNNLLNGKSKAAAVQEKTEGPVRDTEKDFEVVMLDVEDLMPSKDNFYSTENIEELALSIELSGEIEQNLIVKPEAHGKYEVIAGHRRRLAALKLVNEGKGEYRKVPCRIKYETDEIKDKVSLIITNSTTRELTDWEKVEQAKELRNILIEYKKQLDKQIKEAIKAGDYCGGCAYYNVDGCDCEELAAEDKETYLAVKGEGCPCYERKRMGRIREIVANMLSTSTTQIGRMEAIENNLSSKFKEEMKKGNIAISTAHELSRLDEDKQEQAYKQFEEKGKLQIKDVKEETKEEITEEQIERIQKAIMDSVKGEANRDIFKANGNIQGIEKALRKHFEKTFKGSKINLEDGTQFIYRYAAEGITIIDEGWKNYLIEYSDLAEIIGIMIDEEILTYDDTPQEETEERTGDNEVEEETEEPEEAEQTGDTEIPGQADITDYEEYLPEVTEKGLSFTEWVQSRYGKGQYNLIKDVVRSVVLQEAEKTLCPAEWEERVTNKVSIWVMDKTAEYKKYMES